MKFTTRVAHAKRRWSAAVAAAVTLGVGAWLLNPVAANAAVIPEGGTHQGWRVVYDGDVYKDAVSIKDGVIRTRPQNPVDNSTHASLITSVKTYEEMRMVARVRTVSQNRTPANPWESAWVVFDVKGKHTFNYVAVKPNGWEVGHAGKDGQVFLATGNQATPIGQSATVTVTRRDGKTIITIDKVRVRVNIPAAWQGGRVGVYTEDAAIEARISVKSQ